MNLRKYLFEEEITITAFAHKLGISFGHMSRIVRKKLVPSSRLARDITTATQGKVTEKDMKI